MNYFAYTFIEIPGTYSFIKCCIVKIFLSFHHCAWSTHIIMKLKGKYIYYVQYSRKIIIFY